jgi:hypothetical protein
MTEWIGVEDLMIELERRGYKRGDVPYEIIVRD